MFYRNDSSGSTSVFTAFLVADAASDWTLGSSKTITFFTAAQGAKGSAGVAAGVKQTDGGITYVETSYAKAQGLPTASIKGAGDFVDPTSDTVSKAIAEGFSVTGTGNDLAGSMDVRQDGDRLPDLDRVVRDRVLEVQGRREGHAREVVPLYAVGKGQAAADSLGFAPLPSDLATKAEQHRG